METLRADYIVVGSGAAGAVLARRLAEGQAGRVLLVEAGPPDTADPRIRRLADYDALIGSAYDFGYSVARSGVPGRLAHPRGKVLGGSTSTNTCIWFLPPASDLDRWAAEGATGWDAAAMAPALDWLAAAMPVEPFAPDDPAARAWIEACVQAGFPQVDFARPFAEGVGWLRLNARGGLRQSAAVVWLDPASRPPPNLQIVTGWEVERVEVAGRRAVAVAGGGRRAEAAREIVLACGAFNTPKLLWLSGIGPAAELRALGLPVVADLPGVGAGLQEHADAGVNWRAARAPARLDPWNWSSCLFARLDPAEPFADVQLHLGTTGFNRYTVPAGWPAVTEGFSALVNLLRPKSRGRVRLASPDPGAPPVIEPGYFTDPEGADMARVLEGIALARRLSAMPAFAGWGLTEVAPGPELRDSEALADFVRRTHSTDYHPCGTVRMGSDPAAPLTPDLKLRGIAGLRVADASVFPSQVSVNTAASCMAVGSRAAELILSG